MRTRAPGFALGTPFGRARKVYTTVTVKIVSENAHELATMTDAARAMAGETRRAGYVIGMANAGTLGEGAVPMLCRDEDIDNPPYLAVTIEERPRVVELGG